MKLIHRKPSANFPQTPTWGITATKYAVVITLGLHDVVIELQQRKLTQRAPDVGWTCENGHFNPPQHYQPFCLYCKTPRG